MVCRLLRPDGHSLHDMVNDAATMLPGADPSLAPRDFVGGEVLIVDKPLGWTSFDVVKRIRGAILRRLKVKKFKVGHAGTLDPLASGLMIITTGRATKLIDTLQAGVKEYEATLALGSTTPSFDLETEVDATYPTAHITRTLVDEVLVRFHGPVEQVPPAFSACKIEGVRAYDLARRGEAVALKPKLLVIDRIEVMDFDSAAMTLALRIVCSKGTYIRALARDIGQALGSGAHLTALRRTRVGERTLADAMTVDQAVAMIRDCPVILSDSDR